MVNFLENYIDLLSITGKKEKARQKLEEALSIREEILINEQTDVDIQYEVGVFNNPRKVNELLNNLSISLLKMGKEEEAKQKYEEIIEKYEKALEKYKSLLIRDPANIEYKKYVGLIALYLGITLTNLGDLLKEAGMMREARKRYERAIEIYESSLNKKETNLKYQLIMSQSLENCGYLLLIFGKREKARQNFEEALKIREEILYNEKTNVVNHLRAEDLLDNVLQVSRMADNLANFLQEMGRREEAKQKYEKALEKYEKAFDKYKSMLISDPTNTDFQTYVGTTLMRLCVILSLMGRKEESKRRLEEETAQIKDKGLHISFVR